MVTAGATTKSKTAGSMPVKTLFPVAMTEPLIRASITRPAVMPSLPSETMLKVGGRSRTSIGVGQSPDCPDRASIRTGAVGISQGSDR